jgi:anthranilate synthase component 1
MGQADELERLKAPSPADVLRAALSVFDGVEDCDVLLMPGVFSYDFVDLYEDLPQATEDVLGFPDAVFWIPEVLVAVDHVRSSSELIVVAAESITDVLETWTARISSVAGSTDSTDPLPAQPVEAKVDLSDEGFVDGVRQLREHIGCGDVFQAVLSRTFSAPCPEPLDAYWRLRRREPSPYMFYVSAPEATIFGASPETSVRVTDGVVEIRPIAGTALRGRGADGEIDRDLDGRREAALRLDEKELAEHMMLVDLARNDVARVARAGSRFVSRLLTVDRYVHVMHLVSYVQGELRADLDALHAYVSAANMGTLVGAPKIEAAKLLRGLESTKRGPYGGAVGYLRANGDMDTAIIIRSATVQDGVAYVRAGAGVVHDSIPESEALETRRKARAVLECLGCTTGRG